MTADTRLMAYALADMLAEQARDAWHYLDRWEAGIRAGVLAHDLRHAMETELVRAEARTSIGRWVREGERGLLVVRGGVGLGKTTSAVRWVLNRHDRGLRTSWWLASDWPNGFAEQDAVLTMLGKASALVVDDLGDGETAIATMAEDSRSKITAKLSKRFGDGRPTLLLSNASKPELARWLGGRIVDRLSVSGGFVDLADAPSMRRPDETKVDVHGRSPRWHAARKIVDLIGVDRYGEDWQIGRKLETVPGRVDLAIEQLDIDRREVVLRAEALLEHERKAIASIGAELGEQLPLDTLDWNTAAPWLFDRIRAGAEQAAAERAKAERLRAVERESVAASLVFAEVEPPTHVLQLHVSGLQALAIRYGLHIHDDDGEHFAVLHGERLLARGAWSAAQAWWAAGWLIEREVSRREAVDGNRRLA